MTQDTNQTIPELNFSYESSEPEKFSDAAAMVALWGEIKLLREEIMLRQEHIKELYEEINKSDNMIMKFQLVDHELREGFKRYAAHPENCHVTPCTCGLIEFVERLVIV